MMRAQLSALRRHIRKLLPLSVQRLLRDRRGVSAVEFALLLPLMLTLYLGTVEVGDGVSVNRKVTVAARTVADLVAQVAVIDNAGVSNVLNASAAILSPYPAKKSKVTVSVINIDANKKATIYWSDALNGTARTKGASVKVPDAFLVANTSLVLGEVEYSYTPSIGYVVTGTMTLKDQIYMRPRLTEKIERT